MLAFEKSPDGYYIIRTEDGREYAWNVLDDNRFHDLTTSGYEIEIIHNKYMQAMINVFDTKANDDVLRQEINPLSLRGRGQWFADYQMERLNKNE